MNSEQIDKMNATISEVSDLLTAYLNSKKFTCGTKVLSRMLTELHYYSMTCLEPSTDENKKTARVCLINIATFALKAIHELF